jgi:hypothetical protein
VDDAVVRVRRASTGSIREEKSVLPGIYTIADDMLRDSVAAAGEPFEVTVRRRGRSQRTTISIGTSMAAVGDVAPVTPACRCHVRRLAGPDSLVVP